jgi:hypothetical protein
VKQTGKRQATPSARQKRTQEETMAEEFSSQTEISEAEGSGSEIRQAWVEVGHQFEQLGKSLAEAFAVLWESEETQGQLSSVRDRLESLADEVSAAVDKSAASPEAQEMKSEAYKAAEATRQTTDRFVEGARPQITTALVQANAELQKLIQLGEDSQGTVRAAVKRAHAETYLLVSLAAFAGSVIVTRQFLAMTGYPQIGNSVLHIAHALWGGLLLLVAVLLPLLLANGWAFTLSALLSGLGVGLFIDEVGKFITQANDYFFPPAAPVIYATFLLLVLLYLFVRRRDHPDPRAEMYRALAGLHELVDNNLDTRELETLVARLEVARHADQPHMAGLATALHTYLGETDIPLLPARPSRWRRFTAWLDRWGHHLGRRRHRALILAVMALLGVGALLAVPLLLRLALVPEAVRQSMLIRLVTQGEIQGVNAGFWLHLRVFLRGLVGLVALAAIYSIRKGREHEGIKAALLALLLSLTGVILLSFYLDQFRAVITALCQFGALLLVMAYRRWYLKEVIRA